MDKSQFTEDYRVLLDLLRQVREQKGITQVELAARLEATQSFISKCERGERRLDVVELRYWCAALGLPLVSFVESLERSIIEKSPKLRH